MFCVHPHHVTSVFVSYTHSPSWGFIFRVELHILEISVSGFLSSIGFYFLLFYLLFKPF